MDIKLDIVESEREVVNVAQEKLIQCNSCNRFLGTLVISDKKHIFPEKLNMQLPIKYQFECGCGGKSFVIKTENKSFVVPGENVDFTDMKQDGNLFTAKLTER